MTSKEKKRIIKQSARHIWVNGYLFYIGYDLIIRRCVRKDEVLFILKACHDEPCGVILHINEQHTKYSS